MSVLGMASDHDDNPWKFHNHVIIWGTKIVLRSVKPIGIEKESDGLHMMVLSIS